MTRKDYELLAGALRKVKPTCGPNEGGDAFASRQLEWAACCLSIADALEGDTTHASTAHASCPRAVEPSTDHAPPRLY